MKKFILFLVFLCSITMLYSQSQRLVLLEEFTQASCGPCASVNPGIENLLNANPNKITSVWYHTSWPGYDPMYLQNPVDVDARVSLYMAPTNMYVPYSVLDGNYYNGSATGWNISTVNARYAVPSPFSLQLQQQLNSAQDSIFLILVAKCTQDIVGTMVAQNVVIEKNIHFATAPGTNTETDFKNVMKKMLPTFSGTQIPNSFVTGDYVILQTSWALANVYDKTQLAAVSWIQNTSTKEIHQTVNSSTAPLILPYNTDLQVMNISNYSTANCLGKISPSVTIRNNGNNTITSFHVKYQMNNEPPATYTWSGSITSLQSSTIILPEYTFTPLASNNLKIYSTDPNSTNDEYPKNDTLNAQISGGVTTTAMIFVFVRTDNNPQETTWDLKDANGNIVQSHGPYTVPNHTIKDTLHITGEGCYTFTIYDAGNNGLCCDHGNGGYQLIDKVGTTIKQGGVFGSSEYIQFTKDWPTAIQNFDKGAALSVYPNPFNGKATVSYYLIDDSPVQLSLYNLVGQVVKSVSLGMMGSGPHDYTLDGSNLQAGLYILQMKAGSQVHERKVSVTR